MNGSPGSSLVRPAGGIAVEPQRLAEVLIGRPHPVSTRGVVRGTELVISDVSVFHALMEHLTRPEIDHLLETQAVAHIGVVDNGVPYVTPVSFVYDAGAIWFRTAEGRRMDVLRVAPRCCVEVTRYHPYTGMWESVIGWGDAVVLDDAREQLRLADKLEEKYRDPLASLQGIEVERTDESQLGVVKIPLDDVSGRASLRPGGRRTRPGRL